MDCSAAAEKLAAEKHAVMTDPEALDRDDPLAARRALFDLPAGVIYLDGNSLGPLPHAARARMRAVIDGEWGEGLIRSWNTAGWIDLPQRVGDRIARLIGAPAGSVIAADSTTLNVTKALAAAVALRPDRRVILTDSGNFPTDIYAAEGLARLLGRGHEVRLVAPADLAAAIDDTILAVLVTEIDYRTGARHDLPTLTQRAHDCGALAIWDLAHSAGAFPVDVAAGGADFAVGCGYKYLNGGPGAPAFIHVAPRHLAAVEPALAGWMGHAAPFAFETSYRPAPAIMRMTVGTPSVLGLSALDAALDAFEGVDLGVAAEKARRLGDLFIREVEARCARFGLELASPRDATRRGNQVSFHCPDGYAVMQALIAEGVIGDFRAPDIIRFGFAPLYVRYVDVVAAAHVLERVLAEDLWRRPEHQVRAAVT